MKKYPFPEKSRGVFPADPEELLSLSAADSAGFRPALVLPEPDFDNYAELYNLSHQNGGDL